MNGFGNKTVIIPVMMIRSVLTSGVVQVGNSQAVLPHIDTFAAGGPRGAGSFTTQFFSRSRTRFHLANQTDEETVGDLSIVAPAPDRQQFTEIAERYHVGKEILQRFEADGNQMVTIAKKPITVQAINIITVSSSGVLHIGDAKYIMPLVHTSAKGVFAGTVTPAAGGPVGAIGV